MVIDINLILIFAHILILELWLKYIGKDKMNVLFRYIINLLKS